MNLESIRQHCLSFPHATENLQWEDELCFKVGGKIFAMIGLSSVPQRLVFKCGAENFAELTEREGIEPAPYVGRYKWAMVRGFDVLPGYELESLIRESYEMVAAKAKLPSSRATNPKSRRKRRLAS